MNRHEPPSAAISRRNEPPPRSLQERVLGLAVEEGEVALGGGPEEGADVLHRVVLPADDVALRADLDLARLD
eukprot:807098-Rhodomonas_salina.8